MLSVEFYSQLASDRNKPNADRMTIRLFGLILRDFEIAALPGRVEENVIDPYRGGV